MSVFEWGLETMLPKELRTSLQDNKDKSFSIYILHLYIIVANIATSLLLYSLTAVSRHFFFMEKVLLTQKEVKAWMATEPTNYSLFPQRALDSFLYRKWPKF